MRVSAASRVSPVLMTVKMTQSYFPYVCFEATGGTKTDLKQCTIHGGLNQTVLPINECIKLAQSVRCP